jgi:hypothetical protein
MSEIVVTATGDARQVMFTGHDLSWGDAVPVDRWALLTRRDWWVNPARHHRGDDTRRTVVPVTGPVFLRDPSFLVELSDGTVFGGEMSPDFVQRRCVEWVREGKR